MYSKIAMAQLDSPNIQSPLDLDQPGLYQLGVAVGVGAGAKKVRDTDGGTLDQGT